MALTPGLTDHGDRRGLICVSGQSTWRGGRAAASLRHARGWAPQGPAKTPLLDTHRRSLRARSAAPRPFVEEPPAGSRLTAEVADGPGGRWRVRAPENIQLPCPLTESTPSDVLVHTGFLSLNVCIIFSSLSFPPSSFPPVFPPFSFKKYSLSTCHVPSGVRCWTVIDEQEKTWSPSPERRGLMGEAESNSRTNTGRIARAPGGAPDFRRPYGRAVLPRRGGRAPILQRGGESAKKRSACWNWTGEREEWAQGSSAACGLAAEPARASGDGGPAGAEPEPVQPALRGQEAEGKV